MERLTVPLVALPMELELTAQSNVYVLVPQITFTDSTGETDGVASADDYLANNYLGTQSSPTGGCIFINNGVMIFTEPGVCIQTPQEDNQHDLCYHVRTDATRMFMS